MASKKLFLEEGDEIVVEVQTMLVHFELVKSEDLNEEYLVSWSDNFPKEIGKVLVEIEPNGRIVYKTSNISRIFLPSWLIDY